MENTTPKVSPRLKFWIVMAVSAAVRVFKIGTRPIWYDEAIAILRAEKGLGVIIQGTLGADSSGMVSDIHPPGYFLSLFGWMKLFGDSVIATRLLSVIFGLLTVWVAYEILKMAVGQDRAWVGALLVGLSPFQVHYSQEIRMYSLMTLSLSVATLALFKGIKNGPKWWWAIFAFSAAVAQYSQNMSAFYLITLAMVPVLRLDWKNIRNTLLGGLGAMLLYSPWLINIPEQLTRTTNYWIGKPTWFSLVRLLQVFVAELPRINWLGWTSFPVAIIVMTFGLMRTWRNRKDPDTGISAGWFLYLAFSSPILLWVVSQYRPLYLDRVLIEAGVMFCLWLGVLIAQQKTPAFEKWLLSTAILISFTVGLAHFYIFTGFPYAPFQALGENLVETVEEDAVVVHSNKLSFMPLYYFERDLNQEFVRDIPGSDVDSLGLATQDAIGIQESDSVEDAVGDAEKVYFLIFQVGMDDAERIGYETHPHLAYFENGYQLEEKELWDELWLYVFVREE